MCSRYLLFKSCFVCCFQCFSRSISDKNSVDELLGAKKAQQLKLAPGQFLSKSQGFKVCQFLFAVGETWIWRSFGCA